MKFIDSIHIIRCIIIYRLYIIDNTIYIFLLHT